MVSKHMKSALRIGLLATAFGLAACGPVNRGLESVNQPVVSRTDYVLDLRGDALTGQNSAEATRLDAWFDAIDLRYGDVVAIDDPNPYRGGDARDSVAAVVARHGLLLSRAAPVTAGPIEGGSLRVVVSRSVAEVPDCPNWDRISQPELAASGMSNYGCAVNGNLAAMIANPEDLVRGQEAHDSDSRTVTKAIKTYRDAPTTGVGGLNREKTKGGL